MDDKSAQEDEIFALKSIYEENDIFIFDDQKRTGSFYVKHEPPNECFNLNFGMICGINKLFNFLFIYLNDKTI